eukprot:COSAG04_NODE_2244_length_4461_cov_20.784732_4_plen_80_part_00
MGAEGEVWYKPLPPESGSVRAAVALLNPQAAGNGTTVDIHVRFEQLPVLQGRRGCSVFDIWGKNSSTAEQGWTAYGSLL